MRRALSLLFVLFATGCDKPSPATAGSASAAPPVASASGASTASGPATFFVSIVADALDPLVPDPVAPRPFPAGASLFTEAVPLGLKRVEVPQELVKELCKEKGTCIEEGSAAFVEQPDVAERHYLRFVPGEAETLPALRARAQTYLASVAPAGKKFYLAPAYEASDAPDAASEQIGFRTFLVESTPVLSASGVKDATVEDLRGAIVVMVSLTDDAATKLEEATRSNVARRIAVVVGDEVLMSPAIQGAIKGGKLPLGIGKSEDAATARPEAEAVRSTILRARGG